MEQFDGIDRRTCGSHEHIEKTMSRLEEVLSTFTNSSTEFRFEMTKTMAEISSSLKDISEIKITLASHDNRRDSDRNTCDNNRAEIFREIQKIKTELSNSLQTTKNRQDEEISKIKTRQDRKDGLMVVIGGVSALISSGLTAIIMYFKNP